MALPEYLHDFVLPTPPADPVDGGGFDLYLPAERLTPVPLVVLVHGGPMRDAPVRAPREWPVFRGYASALAARGVATAMFDHELLGSLDYVAAAAHVRSVADRARAQADVDGERVAVWYFSGGEPLSATVLRERPSWVRLIALSYPMLQPIGAAEGFSPEDELAAAVQVPVLLTRVGQDFPPLVATQDSFVAAARAAGADLTVIEVPGAHHAFDVVDDTDESRAALSRALAFVCDRLS